MKNENEKSKELPVADRMLKARQVRTRATTRDILGRDFHTLAQTEGKPKHARD